MKNYLEYVRSESKAFYDAGVPALEAAKQIDLGPYGGWTEPERIVFNIERAYRELRGEPWNATVDMMALFRGMFEVRESRLSQTSNR
jgi:cyclase